jgi:hypothetical protein
LLRLFYSDLRRAKGRYLFQALAEIAQFRLAPPPSLLRQGSIVVGSDFVSNLARKQPRHFGIRR